MPQQKKQAIAIDSVNMGGIADSIYGGTTGSLAALVGFDVHSVPGLMLVNQAMSQDSDSTVDDLVKLVPCSDGNIYQFARTNGKIIKRTSAGAYSQEAQVKLLKNSQNLATTLANDSASGTTAWVNPTNATTEDGLFATYTPDDANPTNTSQYLKATNFNFSIPSTATITGIKVLIKKSQTNADGDDYIQDSEVKLVKGGVIQTENKASVLPWPSEATSFEYGDKNDLWETSWLYSDINASTFGVVLKAEGIKTVDTLNAVGNIDYLKVIVYYTDTDNSPLLDAREYDGFIYYAQPELLGRWEIGTTWSSRDDAYAVFKEGYAEAHPMEEQNLVLYIGDGRYIAQVDGSQEPTIFSDEALKLPANYRTTALGRQATNLLVGAKSISRDNRAAIFPWDTWSVSFNIPAYLQEAGVNAFLPDDNRVVVSAGVNGNLYNYDGTSLQRFKQVPPNFPTLYTPSNTATVHYPAVANKQGIPLFGFSNVAGNPSLQGIYGFGSRNAMYPQILTLEFPVSTGSLSNLEIWSMAVVDNDLFVSFKDSTDPDNIVYRVDKLNWSTKINGAYFETRVMKYSRLLLEDFYKFAINYNDVPENTNVTLYHKINHGDWVNFNQLSVVLRNDEMRNQFLADLSVIAKTLQLKVVVTTSGNIAPSIEDLLVLVQ